MQTGQRRHFIHAIRCHRVSRIGHRGQIEAARRAIVRHVKRGGKLWIRVFLDKPVTARAAETRMGKGKGAVDHWVAVVKPGRMIFEIAGVPEGDAREAMRLASHKLPIKTRFVSREEMVGGV